MKASQSEKFLTVTTAMEGNARPWAARVLGLDPTRGFDRQFIGVATSANNPDAPGQSAAVRLPRIAGAIYELGQFSFDPQGNERRLYVQVTDGAPLWMNAGDVQAHFTQDEGPTEDVEIPF